MSNFAIIKLKKQYKSEPVSNWEKVRIIFAWCR